MANAAPRAAARRFVAGLGAAVLIVGVTVSIQAHRTLSSRRDQLRGTIASTATEADAAVARLHAVEAAIAESTRQADGDEAEAERIRGFVERIEQLQRRMADAAAELRIVRLAESQRTAELADLQSCWRTLDAATTSLQARPADADGAIDALQQGSERCTTALQLSHGDSGAVHVYDFADPSVLVVGGRYYAFGTNGPAGTIQVLSSSDLERWEVRDDALQDLPSWAWGGHTWAPSVHRVGSTYVMYYAVRSKTTAKQCISSATSDAPAGPFVDVSSGPLVCQPGLGGSIDPDVYADEHGFLHLIWKSDGSTAAQPAQLWSQYLSTDGRTLLGEPHLMLTADRDWQDHVVENPSMVRSNGAWLLVYSANRWDTDRYTTAFAVCASENGPCSTPTDPVLLTNTSTMAGPGGAQVFCMADGTLMVAWAAWDAGYIGFPNARRLHVGELSVTNLRPTIVER